MAIKFQYNKTSLQSLDKQLKMRVRALPTIKNKESALRSEVKKAKEVADEFDGKLDDTLNEVVNIDLEREFYMRKMELLDRARKKTTQKVNLYEKVQIPGFQEAIRKIKRFLEDEENLSKSAQKIVKTRKAMEDEA